MRLTLTFFCHEITRTRDFRSFIRLLRNLQRLKELDLVLLDLYNDDGYYEWNYPYSYKSEIYKVLFPQLKYLPQVSCLKIKTYNEISDSCLKTLADGIRHLRNLSSLTMDLNFGYNRLSSTTMQKFTFAISRLNKLSHLGLEFRGEETPDLKFNKMLWTSLSRLEKLATLDPKIFRFLSLDSRGLKHFFDSFKNLKRLSCLKLNFADCGEMSTEMMESLIHGFKYLGRLQIPHSSKNERELARLKRISEERYFDLNLTHIILFFPRATALTEESVKGFAKFLFSMKRSLIGLNLDFKQMDKLTDEEMLEFFKHLSNLERLETLKVEFPGKPLTDHFLKNLSFRWSFLPKLSDVKLYFQSPSQITNQGLRALSNNLAMTKKLSCLDLSFSLLPKVGDSSLQAFFYGLENLINLQVLKLDFSKFSQINNKTIFALSEGLANIDKLKTLDLDFSHCKNFENKGLEYLVDSLRDLLLLKTLHLDIYNCQRVDEKGIEYLAEGLQNLCSLPSGWLDIHKSKSISREFIREVSQKSKKKTPYFSFCLQDREYGY